MRRGRGILWAGALVGIIALLAAACGPAAEPTATTAPAAPTATTAAAQSTATADVMEETKLRPIPVVALPAPNPDAQYGGVFRVGQRQSIDTFHGWEHCCGSEGSISGNTLTDFNVFEPEKGLQYQLVPSLAYDWWTDESGEKWTLKLREGVTFHDGEAFTCADAKFMLDTIRRGHDDEGSELLAAAKASLLFRVSETRCVDAYTLEVVTRGPLPSLVSSLALPNFTIYPKHWLEGNQARARTEEPPGTGPWIFSENVPTEFSSWTRNPNYWHNPYPYLDEVRQIDFGARTAMHTAFRVGRVEYLQGHNELPKAQREVMVAEGRLVQDPLIATDGLTALHTNWGREPYNDPRFARALRCAVDSGAMIATALDGEGFEGPIFPLSTNPGGSPWSITLEEWMAIDPCHGPSSLTNMEERRNIARQLLADMGFGPTNPARPRTVVIANNLSWEPVLSDILAVGIEPNITLTGSRHDVQQEVYAGNFELYLHGFGSSKADPDHWLYEHFHSIADRNYGKYTNPEVDALIDLQSQTLELEERYALLHQIERILLRDNAKIIVNHRAYAHNHPPWVKDFYIYTYNAKKLNAVWIDQVVFDRLGG